jgi:hypothetical protein
MGYENNKSNFAKHNFAKHLLEDKTLFQFYRKLNGHITQHIKGQNAKHYGKILYIQGIQEK